MSATHRDRHRPAAADGQPQDSRALVGPPIDAAAARHVSSTPAHAASIHTGAAASSRRQFFKTAAVSSAGFVVALYLPGCRKSEASIPPRTKAVSPNAWLRIDTDGSIHFLCDRSEMGQGVYTALPMLFAEELEVPVESIRVEAAPPGDVYINSLLGGQVTGGSTSIRDGWDKLRLAAAEARERMIGAAAQQWGVDRARCRAENGSIVAEDGRRVTYGAVAELAASMPKVENVKLKPASQFTVIGKPRPRLDTPSKVDGSAVFGIDVKLPGMLYAALTQPPVLGGTIKRVDDTAVKALPGVRAVVQTSAGVAVVADSWWQAHQARQQLKVEWDAGPAAKLDNATIFRGLAAASSQTGKMVRQDGDVEAALKSAAKRVDAVYALPLLAHATLEPQNCTVEFKDGACHVHAPTQIQQFAQTAAAKAAGLPPERVFIHTTLLGGGFGRRLEWDFIPAAVETAKAVGKPVKLLWSREDDMTHDAYRPPARDTISAGFDANGNLTAWKFHLVGPSITSRWAPAVVEKQVDPFAIEAAQNYPYDVPNVYVDFLQHEIGITVGYWRSVSHALNCFVAESFMDELAHSAKKDPYEFRRALLGKQPRFRQVLEAAATKAGWGKAPAGRHQGIAVMEGYGTYVAQVAEVSVEKNRLKLHKIVCAVDCGRTINPSIVEAQAFGGIVFGLTAALFGDITLKGGQVQERNFDGYRLLRINEVPPIEIVTTSSEEAPGGMGEPTTAVIAPALCNAIFAATGKRLRKLPIASQGFSI